MSENCQKLRTFLKLRRWRQKEHPKVLFSQGSVEVSRIMTPDDTNIAGNVHGGTVLRMIEEAGVIIATRHCNKNRVDGQPTVWAALARVERTNFVAPIFVGELATAHAELTYSSKHSLEVQVLVFAENLIKGEHKLCNKASLWYVPVEPERQVGPCIKGVREVPPLEYKTKADEEAGRTRYEAQLQSRKDKEELLSKVRVRLWVVECLLSKNCMVSCGVLRYGFLAVGCVRYGLQFKFWGITYTLTCGMCKLRVVNEVN